MFFSDIGKIFQDWIDRMFCDQQNFQEIVITLGVLHMFGHRAKSALQIPHKFIKNIAL